MNKNYSSLIDRNNKDELQPIYYGEKVLDDSLKESEETKGSELKLFMISVKTFPNKVCNFDWIETLELYNNNLTEIDESFLYFKNLKYLSIEKNNIQNIDCSYFSDTIETLILTKNNTWSFHNLKEGLSSVNFSNNNLNSMQLIIPISVKELDLSNNSYLTKLPIFKSNNNLNNLNISDTSISNIDDIPDSIMILKAYKCNIRYINKFPSNLLAFTAYSSKILTINCDFPQNLFEIDLEDNLLVCVPNFPSTIHKICLKNNMLNKIPKFPSTAKIINISENPRLNISDINKEVNDKPCVNFIYDREDADNRDTDNDDTSNMYDLFKNCGKNHIRGNFEWIFNRANQNYNRRNHNLMFNRETNENHSSYNKPPTFIEKFTKSNPNYIILKNTYIV